LSWSASSEASTAEDDVLRSPPALPRLLPIISKDAPSPPVNDSTSPLSAFLASFPIPKVDSQAPPIGRNLSASGHLLRRPLRRPHSIDTIVSVLSTSDTGVDHYASDTAQPIKNRDAASIVSSSSSAGVAQSIVDRQTAPSFVSVGGPAAPAPGSKEAKKLEKAFKDLMKAQDKLNAVSLLGLLLSFPRVALSLSISDSFFNFSLALPFFSIPSGSSQSQRDRSKSCSRPVEEGTRRPREGSTEGIRSEGEGVDEGC